MIHGQKDLVMKYLKTLPKEQSKQMTDRLVRNLHSIKQGQAGKPETPSKIKKVLKIMRVNWNRDSQKGWPKKEGNQWKILCLKEVYTMIMFDIWSNYFNIRILEMLFSDEGHFQWYIKAQPNRVVRRLQSKEWIRRLSTQNLSWKQWFEY